jgi:hypothetical protein
MLPPPAAVHFSALDGTPLRLDLYDPGTWRREKLSVFSPSVQDAMARQIRLRGGGAGELQERNAAYQSSWAASWRGRAASSRPWPPGSAGSEVAFYASGAIASRP